MVLAKGRILNSERELLEIKIYKEIKLDNKRALCILPEF